MSKSKSKQEQKMVSIGYSHLPSTYGLRTLKKTQHGDDVIPALPSQHKSTTFRLLVKRFMFIIQHLIICMVKLVLSMFNF